MYTDAVLIGNAQFIAGRSQDLPEVLKLLEKEGIETAGNPDVSIREYGGFGIDEARDLSAKAAMRALSSARRYFIACVDSITPEAQNALLKTLEEPPADAVFIFIHPAPQTLLPTVRSRIQILDLGLSRTAETIDVRNFLKASPARRLDLLKPFLEKGDDEKRDMGAILGFLGTLEQELSRNGSPDSSIRLHAVYRARRYIGDRGALIKPLLEQVALLV